MEKEVRELLRQERAKYPHFTNWQLFARVRARILSEYGVTEKAQELETILHAMEKVRNKTVIRKDKLRYKPAVIEDALRHCTTQEQCDGCPLVDVKNEYCGQVLHVETLKYIEVLKDLNATFAQRIEQIEAPEKNVNVCNGEGKTQTNKTNFL